MHFDKSFQNQLLFGFTYLFLLTPLLTGISIQEIIVASINHEYKKIWNGYTWNSYNSLAITYGTSAVSCWLVPSIISVVGVKLSMALGGIGYCLAFSVFIFPFKYGLRLSGILLGLSSASIWTAQGNYLSLTSDSKHVSRNTGMLWTISNFSGVIGNLVVSYTFSGKEKLDKSTRIIAYSFLIGIGLIGVIFAYFLDQPSTKSVDDKQDEPLKSPIKAFVNAMKLLKTKKMLLLSLMSLYTGLEITFYQGLYTASIAYTRAFGVDRKKYSGECGLFIGVGEIIAGLIFIFTAKQKKPQLVTACGFVIYLITFACIFINLPFDATIYDTDGKAIITSNLPLALLCGFLLGLGDGIYQTQIYEFIASVYKDDSSPPFAIFTSLQAIGTCTMFLLSNYIKLNIHIIILILGATIGTAAFFSAGRLDLSDKKKHDIEMAKHRVSVASQTCF